MKFRFFVFAVALFLTTGLSAQKYPGGLVDKTVAVVGNEVILVSDIESAVQQEQAQGRSSDRDMRCSLLERMMENKIFLMQARIDSLTVNYDMVTASSTTASTRTAPTWAVTRKWKNNSASRSTSCARSYGRCSRSRA